MKRDMGKSDREREKGIHYHYQNVQENNNYGEGLIVQAGIKYKGKIVLCIFEKGSMTSQWYAFGRHIVQRKNSPRIVQELKIDK